MEEQSPHQQVLDLVKAKSMHKRDVFELLQSRFQTFKEVLKELTEEFKTEVAAIDPRLEVAYKDLGAFYCQLTIAGDVLLFSMHTNVFRFPNNSVYWRSSYLQEDKQRGYVGIIQIHNFLADSFRYHREQDLGYLIGRLFINSEDHYFLEGKKELGYKYNDFVNAVIDRDKMKEILCSIITYTIKFDLYIPAYSEVQEVTLREVNRMKDNVNLRTGKRLGFQFQWEDTTSDD